MDSGSGDHGSPRITRLTNVQADTWKEIKQEKGATRLEPIGPARVQPRLSRRGSIIMSHTDEEGNRTVDILHSVRTARQLEPPNASLSARQRTREASTYRPPDYPRTVHGHDARVSRVQWTPERGFEPVDEATYHSGKSGGDFGPKTMKALKGMGWPQLHKPEDSHHSEAEYAAKNYAESVKGKVQPPDSGFLVHQMSGVNDMCTNCRAGLSTSIAKADEGHIVTYTSQQPFRTQGEWDASPKQMTMSGPGTIIRSRPETQSAAHRQVHLDRAKDVRRMRTGGMSRDASPERSGERKEERSAKREPSSASRQKARPFPSIEASKTSSHRAPAKLAPSFKPVDAPKPTRKRGRSESNTGEPAEPMQSRGSNDTSPRASWKRQGGRLVRGGDR